MRLVNCTPHPIDLVTEGGVVTVPPSGIVVRVAEVPHPRGSITVEGVAIPLVEKRFGQLEGLPEPQEGVLYILSALAATAAWAQGRRDVVTVGDPVRVAEGRVVGARALCVCPEGGA